MIIDPPAIDLRDFPYMPLFIGRLQRSKAWLRCKRRPELAFYLLNLWMRAWHEVPAGSIENDDDVLADAAMCDPRQWEKIKDEVLRGWIVRDDRIECSALSEIAIESWSVKQRQRQRTESARQSKSQRRDSRPTGSVTEPVTGGVTSPVTESVTEPVTDSKGIEGNRRESTVLRTEPPSAAPAEPPTMRQTLWRDGIPILRSLIGLSDARARTFLGGLLKSTSDDCAKVYRALCEARDLKPADPSAWITAACGESAATRGRQKRADPIALTDALMNGHRKPPEPGGGPIIDADLEGWRDAL